MDQILLSHPGCPPFAQNASRALYEADMLLAYVTSFSFQTDSRLSKAIKIFLKLVFNDPEKQLMRRRITELPEEKIITHPFPELLRTLVAKSPLGPIAADLVWEKMELLFDKTVAKKHLQDVSAVYGYEHAALRTFEEQKSRGGMCIYDMPTCHYAAVPQIVEPEFEKYPEAITSYDQHIRRLAPKRNARKDKELQIADHIIAASTFTKRTLISAGIPEKRISVVPYGAPQVSTQMIYSNDPFVFLSVGNQSVRKGIHYLLDAWRRLAPKRGVELWLVGQMHLPNRLLTNLPGTVVIRPSVPKQELFEIYKRATVLTFPALAEGFGMVITEAMAHGVPVITTENTAGPQFIEHGKNGFIIPACDSEKLYETMLWCLDNRNDLPEMGRLASIAAGRWQWSDYRAALVKVVCEVTGANSSLKPMEAKCVFA